MLNHSIALLWSEYLFFFATENMIFATENMTFGTIIFAILVFLFYFLYIFKNAHV